MIKRMILPFAGIIMGAMAMPAVAEDAKINSMSYTASAINGHDVIHVYSSDGQDWDTISGPPLKFTANMDVDTQWPGYVDSYGVFLGQCVDTACAQNPLLRSMINIYERDFQLSRNVEILMDQIPVSSDQGIAIIPLGDQILNTCNEHQQPGGPTALYTYDQPIWTSFSVNTRKAIQMPSNPYGKGTDSAPWPDFNGGDETRQDTFVAQVECHPYADDFDDDPNQDFDVEDVELFLSTFSNEVTHPDPDTECRKGRILVRVTTNQAGPVSLRLWTAGVGPLQDEYIQAWSSHVGSGVYQAEVIRWVSVSETSLLESMVEVDFGFVGLQDGWDDLVLECITDTPDFAPGDSPADGPRRGGGNFTSR